MIKKIALSLFLFFAIERFCHFQTDGFALSKMMISSHPSSQPGEITLTFIGAGKQYYAFETPDHNYVVKFMKFSRRRPLPWLEKLPLPSIVHTWRSKYLAERAKRLSHLQRSGALAYKTLPQETGLVSSDFLPSTVTLIDKLGIHHTIDMSQTCFYVQKKAILFPTYFASHPSESLITSYITTVASQCRKGVCNLDPILDRNFGVVDDQLIILDFGSLLAHHKLRHHSTLQQEIFLELLPLRDWLLHHYPHHVPFFDAQLKKTISRVTIAEQQEV